MVTPEPAGRVAPDSLDAAIARIRVLEDEVERLNRVLERLEPEQRIRLEEVASGVIYHEVPRIEFTPPQVVVQQVKFICVHNKTHDTFQQAQDCGGHPPEGA